MNNCPIPCHQFGSHICLEKYNLMGFNRWTAYVFTSWHHWLNKDFSFSSLIEHHKAIGEKMWNQVRLKFFFLLFLSLFPPTYFLRSLFLAWLAAEGVDHDSLVSDVWYMSAFLGCSSATLSFPWNNLNLLHSKKEKKKKKREDYYRFFFSDYHES